MLVELRLLKPNPLRDFTVDPIDDERVADLKESIKEDGFWGGVVCRQVRDGTVQIAAGHHRVKAALAAGLREADVFVADDMDDAGMVRVYARENATQRGNTGTAQAGSVASAIRYIAKMITTGMSLSGVEISTPEMLKQGIGWRPIVQFLGHEDDPKGMPGINEGSVQQALANLKSSGDYSRIIHEVQEEIERENKEALKALEKAEREQRKAEEEARRAEAERKEAAARAKVAREEAEKKRAELERQRAEAEAKLAENRRKEAEEQMKQFEELRKTRDTARKAAEASNNKPITFDFEGVAKHLKNAHQIDVFRKQVTGPGIAPYLPVNQQEELAKHLVKLARDRDAELSGAFIRENVTALVLQAKSKVRELDKEERRRLEEQDWLAKAKRQQEDFSRNCRGMAVAGNSIKELLKKWPKELPFPISSEFRNALDSAKRVIDYLYERV